MQVEGTNWAHLARLNADGSLDYSYAARPNRPVYSMLQQPDGRVLIGGEFNAVNGQFRDRVARLEADGTLDTNFQSRLGLNGIVHCMALQADGKLIIGGVFSIPHPGGGYMHHLARLGTNGAVDFTFNAGTNFYTFNTASNFVRAVLVLPDGKILVGGGFHRAGGSTRDFLARLLPDGTLDTDYLPMRFGGPDGPVRLLNRGPGEVIFAAGSFTNFNGSSVIKIARLFPDGLLDESFRLQAAPQVYPPFYTFGRVSAFSVDDAGRLTVAYSGGTEPNLDSSSIQRYSADGRFDTNFANSALYIFRGVHCMESLPDGGIFLGGSFDAVKQFVRRGVARLLGDLPGPPIFSSGPHSWIVEGGQQFMLTAPTTFSESTSFQWFWNGAVRLGGTNIYLTFSEADPSMSGEYWLVASNQFGVSTSTVATVTVRPSGRPGSVVRSFVATPGPNSNILAMAEASDGKVYLGGYFTNYHGTQAVRMARILSDGTPDSSFVQRMWPDSLLSVSAVLASEDGKVIAAGITPFGSPSVIRFRDDGSQDSSWRMQLHLPFSRNSVNSPAWSLLRGFSLHRDAEGKLYVGGPFFRAYPSSSHYLPMPYSVRLLADGQLDSSFKVQLRPSGSEGLGYYSGMAFDGGGRLFLSGQADEYSLQIFNTVIGVLRLNSAGSRDETFALMPRTTNHLPAHSVVIQNDGRILVTGGFSQIGTNTRPGLARFLPDGLLDESFVPWSGAGNYSFILAIQKDQKILAVTDFDFRSSRPSGTNRLVRLNPDGSLDADFDIGDGPDGYISTALIRSDGNILVGGRFSRFSGFHCHGIALLHGDRPKPPSISQNATSETVVAGDVLQLTALVEGFPIPQFQWLKNGVPIPGANQESFRLRSVGWNDAGVYSLVASNAYGVSTSIIATVSVQAGRLNADWVDSGFSAEAEPNGEVHVIAPQPDGRILIGGQFTRVGSVPRPGIARLLSDGRLDESFRPLPNFSDLSRDGLITVSRIVVMPDGKMAISRTFVEWERGVRSDVVRLHEDGRLDSSFPNLLNRNPLLAFPDGRLLVGLGFPGLQMFAPDGSVDGSFVVATNRSLSISFATLQADGRVVVASEDGVTIDRFMPNGARDATFDRSELGLSAGSSSDVCFPLPGGAGPSPYILAQASQSDGKILIGGVLSKYVDGETSNLLRLLPSGRIDRSFNAWSRANYAIRAIAVQPDGKILIGGCFTNVGRHPLAVERLHLSRLHPNGSVDATFNPAPTMRGSSSGYVRAMALQPDGRVLIGGLFDSVNGATRRNLARLNGDLVMFQSVSSDEEFSTRVATIEGRTYFLETRAMLDSGSWVVVDSEPGTGTATTLTHSTLDGGMRYYRVRVE